MGPHCPRSSSFESCFTAPLTLTRIEVGFRRLSIYKTTIQQSWNLYVGHNLPAWWGTRPLNLHSYSPRSRFRIFYWGGVSSTHQTWKQLLFQRLMSSLIPPDFSDASQEFRASQRVDVLPMASIPEAGEVHVSPELVDAFRASLSQHNVILRFSAGAWSNFNDVSPRTYDLVLSSETIYRTSSVPSLIEVLRRASRGTATFPEQGPETLALVAAKVVYFGVGGGIREFVDAVQRARGQVKSVWETKAEGVGRQILQVTF